MVSRKKDRESTSANSLFNKKRLILSPEVLKKENAHTRTRSLTRTSSSHRIDAHLCERIFYEISSMRGFSMKLLQ